jgi:sarcosine oxidase subunit beta
MGASIAYHLALLGADDVVLCDVGEVASGATGKAMGGVRQQFSTEAEVRLAQASIAFFRELGAPFFFQVGYLFLATTEVGGDVLVVACGPRSGELFPELPIRPLVRQLVDVGPVANLPETLPMIVEEETTFHFRRRDAFLRLALREPVPRWSSDEFVDDALVQDVRARLAYRYPAAAGVRVERAWAGLYDMTPDAHPIIGPLRDDVYVAAGFSGHGFMQSPAVGRAVAEELLELEPTFDLAPYRLERFAGDEVFPEELVL